MENELKIRYHDDNQPMPLGMLRTKRNQQGYGPCGTPLIILGPTPPILLARFEGESIRIDGLCQHPRNQSIFAFMSRPNEVQDAKDNGFCHSSFVGLLQLKSIDLSMGDTENSDESRFNKIDLIGSTKIRSMPYSNEGNIPACRSVSSELRWFADGVHLAFTERWYIHVFRVDLETGTFQKPLSKSPHALLQRRVNSYMSCLSSNMFILGFEISPDERTVILSLCEGNEDDNDDEDDEEELKDDEENERKAERKRSFYKKSFHKIISL
jgi:hypothetical protein